MRATTSTVVVGLGNPVRGDDAVGLRVVEQLDALLRHRPVTGVRVCASTRGGIELLDLLAGADVAVVVDCVEGPAVRPGRLRWLSPIRVAGAARLVGSHDIGLAAAIELGRVAEIPMPWRVEILGIEARIADRLEEGLTPEVEAGAGRAARRLHQWLSAGSPSRRS